MRFLRRAASRTARLWAAVSKARRVVPLLEVAVPLVLVVPPLALRGVVGVAVVAASSLSSDSTASSSAALSSAS